MLFAETKSTTLPLHLKEGTDEDEFPKNKSMTKFSPSYTQGLGFGIAVVISPKVPSVL